MLSETPLILQVEPFAVWPEVGSWAMQRLTECGQEWIDVQTGRYRYLGTADHGCGGRLVLSGYLACEVSGGGGGL
jgi:hypothetical protein